MGSKKKNCQPLYSEEKFSKVFHVNPAICAIIDLHTDAFLDVNDTFVQKLKYNREQLLKSKISELFKLSKELKDKAFKELKETGRINNIDVNLHTATGQEIPTLFSGETVVLGGVKYLYAVGIDISDKVESEKQLKLSEMRLIEAESIAQMGHYSLNVKTGIWECSESLNNIFGIDNSDTKDLELWQKLLAPEYRDEMMKYFLEEVVLKHNKFDKEYQIVTLNDKTLKWIHGRGVLKFNEKDEVMEMVGTIQDITKIKTNQLKLKKSENALRKIIGSTMGKSGQDYLNSMACSLSQITMADCTFIAEKVDNDSVKTVSAYQTGKKMSDFSYRLEGTPCNNVMSKKSCIYTSKVAKLFPEDVLLKELEAEAYIGTPIFDQNAGDIGIIVSLFKKPLVDTFFIQSIFEICSSSIGSEMQRTRAELRVLENEQTMNTIFDNAPFIMVLLNDKAEIVKINKTGTNLKDYSADIQINTEPGPIMGCIFQFSNVKECGKSEACQNCSVMNIFKETLRTGEQTYKSEAELTTWYEDQLFQHTFLISSSRVEQEGHFFVLLTLDDITESKMMEQKMYENEITLNKIFDHAPVIMMLVNEKSEIIKINRAAYNGDLEKKNGNLFPRCKDILNCVGNEVSGSEHENDLCNNCIIKDTLEITLETGLEVFKKEVDIITVNHSELKLKTYLISSTLIDKGKSKKVLLTLDDITDRKKTEEELKQSKERSSYNEKRYRLLSDLTFEGILLHQNRRIIDANRALLKMTGYSYSEIIGQDSMSFIFPAEYESFFIQKLTENHSHPYETVVIKKNGNRIPVELESRYFKQNNQRIRVSAIRDITDRKVLEKKVLQAVMQTEENERARFAQELHDGLGPILSNVQMYFQWLAEEDDNKQFVYEKGSISLKNAFSTLREISNKLSPHILHNFGLLQAVNNFIDSLVSKNIRIDVQTNIESIRFDPNIEISLYRVVTELINNSLKYSSATLIKLKIILENNLLAVVYSDNGKGFNISEIQKASKGYGMINISNRIRTLQGKIDVKSQIDKGVQVEIKININKH